MKVPGVSVVVPAFNACDWIEATLASVQAQTFPHDSMEIIVVDDGSTDATRARAQQVLESGDISFSIQRRLNAGPSAARNFGWRRARGDWVQFLDADDILEPTKIEFQVRAVQEYHSRVAAVYSEWGRLSPLGGDWTPEAEWVMPRFESDPLSELLGTNNHMATGSQLFRRTWLERVGGYTESYTRIEDVDLLVRIVILGGELSAAPAGKPLFWYRQHPHSLSHSDAVAFFNGCVRNARFVEEYWRERNALGPAQRQFLAELYFGAARVLAEEAPADFDRVVDFLYRVVPNFVPPAPLTLKWLTRGLGYARAEQIAVRFRQIKRKLLSMPWVRNAP